jgi:hypothetical protein
MPHGRVTAGQRDAEQARVVADEALNLAGEVQGEVFRVAGGLLRARYQPGSRMLP